MLSTTDQNIGCSGIGNFAQSGGTNSANNLELGTNVAGSGSYTLSNSGLLLTENNEVIGLTGSGSFMQLGGTNSGLASWTLEKFPAAVAPTI